MTVDASKMNARNVENVYPGDNTREKYGQQTGC